MIFHKNLSEVVQVGCGRGSFDGGSGGGGGHGCGVQWRWWVGGGISGGVVGHG